MHILGIDIGGTGIKGAPVDTAKGKLLSERLRVPTPDPATPKAVVDAVGAIVDHFRWEGPIGATIPAVVKDGHILTAANIDPAWLGTNLHGMLKKKFKAKVAVLNDADAAGLAEMRFGAGKNEPGKVLMVTLGTGIGTSLFFRGMLVPHSELGHLELQGKDAEKRASNHAREKKDLTWKQWGKNVDDYLAYLEQLLWPDLFIIGGGVSKKADEFFPFLKRRARVVPAKLLNDAGIVGAAAAAGEDSR